MAASRRSRNVPARPRQQLRSAPRCPVRTKYDRQDHLTEVKSWKAFHRRGVRCDTQILPALSMIQSSMWQFFSGLPAYGEIFTFHREDELFVREGLVVEFTPGEDAWIGDFALGAGGLTAVYIVGGSAFVIAAGAGYQVQICDPNAYSTLRPGIILDACIIDDMQLLVLAGAVNVSGYGAEGRRWTTVELLTDGVRLQACRSSGITGVTKASGDDRREDRLRQFPHSQASWRCGRQSATTLESRTANRRRSAVSKDTVSVAHTPGSPRG
jgi:hypothetical protein